MQIFADVIGAPVQSRDDDPALNGCRGAAIIAGVAAGVFSDYREADDRMNSTPRVYTPDPGRLRFYRDAFAPYRRIVAALDDVYDRVA